MTDDLIIRMKHVRKAKLCARGCREWFTKYGKSYSHFLEHGITESELVATGCQIALKVVAIAREEADSGR